MTSGLTRLAPLVLAMAVAAPGLATAQSSAASAPQGQRTVRSMFAFADINRDGQLTRAEAKGHLPLTYKSFKTLDIDKRGWISFEQFVEFTNKRVGKQADDILRIGEWL